MARKCNTIEDILLNIEYIPWNGCWIWLGKIAKNGYGHVTVNRKTYLTHRFIYEKLKNSIPFGLCLDHLCRNRDCVNPDHLEPVSSRENILRGVSCAAINFNKTECQYGHLYTEKNLYICPKGKRECKQCRRNNAKRYQLKKAVPFG